MDIGQGELLDSVVDVWQVTHSSSVQVNLFDVANAHTRESNVNLRVDPIDGSQAVLMDPVIDESRGNCFNSRPRMCWTTEADSGRVTGGCQRD